VLKRAGTVRQVGRQGGHVLWALQGAKVVECPFGGKTLPDIAEQLLREHGPMNIAELVVKMRERGYRPSENPRQTHANMLRGLTRFSQRFSKTAEGRWSIAENFAQA
jgi:hypothetical protein